ncbi:hypothetical protein AB0G02_23685 [Actinosynnema sp. NPDC023658]|uniref:hypothetical protein n=1 Tax=Actinosynnema sp. NPDC023658 TaxID=3155465 RepID=UPI0033DEE417
MSMSVKARWTVVAAVVVVAAAGVALWPQAPDDPHAYAGSHSGFGVGDVERLAHVPVPGCAREGLRYFVFPLDAESVWFDFPGSAECVDEFLTGAGLSTGDARPGRESVGLIAPPPESGARWEVGPGDRVQEWQRVVESFSGEQVDVRVNRSAEPQHVYVRAFATT